MSEPDEVSAMGCVSCRLRTEHCWKFFLTNVLMEDVWVNVPEFGGYETIPVPLCSVVETCPYLRAQTSTAATIPSTGRC